MLTWLSWPRFQAPLHNFPPLWGAVKHCWTRWQHQMHFHAILLIKVIEIWFSFQICVQCAKKAISKITFNIHWNLKQIWRSWHTWVSKGNIKEYENNGGLSGLIREIRLALGAWTGVGGNCICVVILPSSLRPSGAMWRQGTGSTLAQVMACCLTAPSHFLDQCWLIISKVLWRSCEANFTRNT